MVAITNILVLATAVAASVLRRDVQTLKNDFMTINADTLQLTQDVNNYNGGGIANALPIQNHYNAVDQAINSANTDARNSAPFSAMDAQTLINYINNTLEPNVARAINALNRKKNQLAADGVASIVCSDLQTLKSDTDAFAASLLAKVPSSKLSKAQAARNKIDADFNRAISTYC